MTLDAQRFPRAAAYLEQLPAGLDSHPDCLVRVDGRENLVRDFSELSKEPGIPAAVRLFLEGSVAEKWMPEVISVTALSMARDVILDSDDALRQWTYRDALDVFDSPLNKMLMKVLSPTLVVMGAAKRWGNWRTGSTLTATPVRQEGGRLLTELDLSYPAHLYDDVSLIQLGQVFVAAVEASNGRVPQLTHEALSASAAHFVVSWQK